MRKTTGGKEEKQGRTEQRRVGRNERRKMKVRWRDRKMRERKKENNCRMER